MTNKIKFLISLLILSFFAVPLYANEKILICKMNYGISGENDETDIEFEKLEYYRSRSSYIPKYK